MKKDILWVKWVHGRYLKEKHGETTPQPQIVVGTGKKFA